MCSCGLVVVGLKEESSGQVTKKVKLRMHQGGTSGAWCMLLLFAKGRLQFTPLKHARAFTSRSTWAVVVVFLRPIVVRSIDARGMYGRS